MAQYEPTSRRPIGEGFRSTAHYATALCVQTKIHPDAISYASVVAAAIAAFCFWKSGFHPALLFVAPLFCHLRIWFNMLDGMVAIASGKASWRGEILNDLPDRVSDVLIFAGVAHSGWMHPLIGYWAAILAVLAAYAGLFGQALGVGRQFGGIMSKPWRMVALHFGAWATFALRSDNQSIPSMSGFTIIDWCCFLVIAGCLQTIFVRLKRITAALHNEPQ